MIVLNISELEEFIEELNEQLRLTKGKYHKNLRHEILPGQEQKVLIERKELRETELRVYIKISHYFRLTTITIPNINIAYEIWLKGILDVLLQEIGLTAENWDEICTIGDHNRKHLTRVDREWPKYLEDIRRGNINPKVWELIQIGKKRAQIVEKTHITRKKFGV